MRKIERDVHTGLQTRQLPLLGHCTGILIWLLGALPAITMADADFTPCPAERPQICTYQYDPVCARRDTGIRCITTPCDSTEWRTYGNACTACGDARVEGHVPGTCPDREDVSGETDQTGSGRPVPYALDGQAYDGWYVDGGADAPLVLLLHDWDGLTDYEKRRASMLAEQGYSVFAADLFGAGIRPTEDRDKRQHTGALYSDRDKLRRLLSGALKTAAALGASARNAVAMGYCFGGAAVLEMARAGMPLRGFVSFHGGLATPPGQSYQADTAPILVLHGSADAHISLQDLATLGSELESAGVAHELISYSGAPHAFTVFGSDRYREDADRKSWRRFLQFLEETLAEPR